MASVRKRDPSDPNSPWVCEYTDATGKRRRITPKTGLKKDAEAHRRKIEAEIDQGIHQAVSTTVMVDHAVKEYLADCHRRWREKDRMTGNTLSGYSDVCRLHILPAFGARKLTDLTTEKIDDVLRRKVAEGRRSTARQMHTVLWNILKFAVRRRWVKRSCLADETTSVVFETGERISVPALTDIQSLLTALKERPEKARFLSHLNRRALVMLGVFGGMRKGEIAGLQWKDVDFDKGIIFVRHSLSKYDGLKEPKTPASRRTIHMTAPIREALEEVGRYWLAREGLDLRQIEASKNTYTRRVQTAVRDLEADADLSILQGYMLRTTNGRAYDINGIYGQLWIPTMKEAGLTRQDGTCKFSIHSLRHAAASLFIDQGLTSFRLKHAIGHKSEAITYGVYGHLFPEDDQIRTAAEAIAGRFDATQTRLKGVRP